MYHCNFSLYYYVVQYEMCHTPMLRPPPMTVWVHACQIALLDKTIILTSQLCHYICLIASSCISGTA